MSSKSECRVQAVSTTVHGRSRSLLPNFWGIPANSGHTRVTTRPASEPEFDPGSLLFSFQLAEDIVRASSHNLVVRGQTTTEISALSYCLHVFLRFLSLYYAPGLHLVLSVAGIMGTYPMLSKTQKTMGCQAQSLQVKLDGHRPQRIRTSP